MSDSSHLPGQERRVWPARDSIVGIVSEPSRRSAWLRPRMRAADGLDGSPAIPRWALAADHAHPSDVMTMMTNTGQSRAAELLNPIDGDQRPRYPRFVPLAAAFSRFASPDAKLIRFVGRKPRPGLPILTSPPGCHTRAVSRPRRGQSVSRLRRRHVTARCALPFHLPRWCASTPHVDARPSFRSRTQCCPPQPIQSCGNRRSISALGRRIMAKRRRARFERRQQEGERQRAFRENDSSGPTDVRLRQLVRAIARQAARDLFDAQRRQHSNSVH
jgi:hypothetical protein